MLGTSFTVTCGTSILFFGHRSVYCGNLWNQYGGNNFPCLKMLHVCPSTIKCIIFVFHLTRFSHRLSKAFIANRMKRRRVKAVEQRGDNTRIAVLPGFLEQVLKRIFESQGGDATFLDYLTFEDGAIDYTETSIQNYHCTLRHIREERRSRNHEPYQLYCPQILWGWSTQWVWVGYGWMKFHHWSPAAHFYRLLFWSKL